VIVCGLSFAEATEVSEDRVAGALPRFTLRGRQLQTLLEAFVEPLEELPFEDLLLGFVVPCLIPQIAYFHERGGPGLADLYSAEALSRLDIHLARRLDDFAARVVQSIGTGREGR
jgi:hypothetical protein